MTTFVLLAYIVLMAVFLVASALIIRHAFALSYVSSRFKKVVAVFGVLAVIVIAFSVYLLFILFGSSPSTLLPSFSRPSSSSNLNF